MIIDYPDVERTLADAFGDMRPVAVAYLEKLPATPRLSTSVGTVEHEYSWSRKRRSVPATKRQPQIKGPHPVRTRSATLTVGLSPAPVRSLLGWPLQSPLADRTECNDDCALHLSFDHSMKALPSSA
jgi:hypothetical protein